MLLTVILSLRPEGLDAGWTLGTTLTFLATPTAGPGDPADLHPGARRDGALSCCCQRPAGARPPAPSCAGHRLFRLVMLVPLVDPGLIGALGLLLFWGPRGWFNLLLTQFVPGVDAAARRQLHASTA